MASVLPPTTSSRTGRHPTYLTSSTSRRRSVTFDVIQFLTGEEAIAAYEEDVPEDPDVGPPNDYWIRNVSSRLRTLPIAPDVAVTVVRLGRAERGRRRDVDAGRAAGPPRRRRPARPTVGWAWSPFWLTVEDGVVVAIEEQYLP
jgi:hypothetical protein